MYFYKALRLHIGSKTRDILFRYLNATIKEAVAAMQTSCANIENTNDFGLRYLPSLQPCLNHFTVDKALLNRDAIC